MNKGGTSMARTSAGRRQLENPRIGRRQEHRSGARTLSAHLPLGAEASLQLESHPLRLVATTVPLTDPDRSAEDLRVRGNIIGHARKNM